MAKVNHCYFIVSHIDQLLFLSDKFEADNKKIRRPLLIYIICSFLESVLSELTDATYSAQR